MLRTTGGCYNVLGGGRRRGLGRAGAWRGALRPVADHRLHHERVLEVTDVVAVLRLTLVDACEGKRGETWGVVQRKPNIRPHHTQTCRVKG